MTWAQFTKYLTIHHKIGWLGSRVVSVLDSGGHFNNRAHLEIAKEALSL